MLMLQHHLTNKAELQKSEREDLSLEKKRTKRYTYHIRLHHSSSQCPRKDGAELAEKKSKARHVMVKRKMGV